MKGRRHIFDYLQNALNPHDRTIWVHVASLGEYEQGLPILEALKQQAETYKIVLTFFSPSGYEVKKNTGVADVVTYLPIDTPENAKKFLEIINPSMAIFVKYEVWPNYLFELKKRKCPTFMISAIFHKRQVYFRWYGGFMRNALKSYDHFFVQNENSQELLQSIGFDNITISGDTRFDRVGKISQEGILLDFMEAFKKNSMCMVAGSTWTEDEEILVDFINSCHKQVKFVIAPHNIKPKHIDGLRVSIKKETVLYSEFKNQTIENVDVLIVDTIGLLTQIYSYANIAYVGGGFATGLHNTLEPAVFGVPVLVGPQFDGFQEVEDLIALGGIISINNYDDFKNQIEDLLVDSEKRTKIGSINTKYVSDSMGATSKITAHLKAFI